MTSENNIAGRFAARSGAVRAAVWITASAFSYVAMISVVRQVAPDIHVFEVVFFRSLFGAVLMIPWMMRHGLSLLRSPKAGLLTLRGVCAFVAGASLFHAVTLMPLGEMMAITFTRPFIATVGAIVFLGEIAHGRRWTAILVGFAGALIVVRPGFAVVNTGVFFVLIGVAMQVINTIIIKYATRTEHPDVIATYHVLVVTPMALIPTLFVWTMPTLEQFAWLAVCGAASMAVQRTMVRAFAATDATVVMGFGFIRLPVAALAGYLFFAEMPGPWVWVGGGLIVAASLFLVRRESAAECGTAA